VGRPRVRRELETLPAALTTAIFGSLLPAVVPTSKPPSTYISDLRPSRVATIEAEVVQLEEPREVPTREGGTTKVRNGRLRDGTGEIALVLWGKEVDLVQQGDKVRITEGWVKDYQGRPQIGLGRTGKLEKLGSG
jgi:replication factor A1